AFGPAAIAALLRTERPVRFALCLAGILAASVFFPSVHGRPLFRERSFFGVHRVMLDENAHVLVHGNTVHGKQWLAPDRRDEPLTYYHRTGPVGKLLLAMKGDARLGRVGLVGLGSGAIASYAQSGQKWTFFEIDP